MNKVFGNKSLYAPIRKDYNRLLVNYECNDVSNSDNATWHEITFYTFNTPVLTVEMIKDAIIKDINSQVDEKILNGFQWTILNGDNAGNSVNVWLSKENQIDFLSFYTKVKNSPSANDFPATFKISEDDDRNAINETFNSIEEFDEFYTGLVAHIKNAVAEGQLRKAAIDYSVYKQALANLTEE